MPKIARGLGSIPPKPIYVLLSLGREPGMVSLGVGEPNFEAPKEAVQAAKESLDEEGTHYTPDPGTIELREAILEKTKRDNNFSFDIESEIMVTAGSSAAVFGAAMVAVEAGDEVILPAPAYLAYEPIVKLAGGTPVFVSAREDTAFVPTEEAIKEAISPKTSAFIVCSPNC